jgi:esterase/lipase
MKRRLKKIGIYFISVITVCAIAYFSGPKPDAPKLEQISFSLPNDLVLVEKQVNESERATPGIRQGCEAKIIWADSTEKVKTKYVFLYIHGFGASRMEADPVHRNVAKKYSSNLYLARLSGHGIDLGDSTMAKVTANDFVYSIEYALSVAKTLGNEVIVMSNSFGGALSLWLASVHPEIKALILYSPCVKTYDERMGIFTSPWGLQIIEMSAGTLIFDSKPLNREYAKYWTTHYHLNGLAAFQNFLDHTVKKEIFEKIKCPTFLGYTEKDTVASVPAMLQMFEELSSANKQRFDFSNEGTHEITTPIFSKNIEAVQNETEKFLEGILLPH